jgi:hypothetical protein
VWHYYYDDDHYYVVDGFFGSKSKTAAMRGIAVHKCAGEMSPAEIEQ